MPAQKRSRDQPLEDSPPSKRHAAESPNENWTTSIIELLRKCAQKQRDYIVSMENVLVTQEPRFKRLQLHLQYHLELEKKRFLVQFFNKEQIKEYEKKISGYKRQIMIEKMDVEEMEKQEEKLEKIVQDVVKYKGYRLQEAEKRDSRLPDSNSNGPTEQTLEDALINIPSTFRDDERMETVPKLQKEDLDKIEWPQVIHDWSQYSVHWNSECEEAAECQNLNEKINVLKEKLAEVWSVYEEVQVKKDIIKLYDENRNCPIHSKIIRDVERTDLGDKLKQLIRTSFEKEAFLEKLKENQRVLEASKKQREDLLKSIQEEVNAESLKCSVCFEALTNGERSQRCPQLFGSCGHTVCATCMQQFKARHSPYHWTCPQCRKPSDKVLTNWALMQLIKEIPGQPQRVVVDAPQAVPIVPAPWRPEEQRRDPEPHLQEERMENIMEEWNIAEGLEWHMERFEAPLRPWAPMGDPIAPAPEVPLDREPDQEPNFMEDIDDVIDRHRRRIQEIDRDMLQDLEDMNERQANRARAERLPMFPPPRDLATMVVNPPPRAIAPGAPPPPFALPEAPDFDPRVPPPGFIMQPVQDAQLVPNPLAPPPPPAPLAPQAAPALQAVPMENDDIEVLEHHIRVPPQVRQPAVQIEEGIEYIVLD